ncbi:MAG: hypothetical protein NVV57_12790 [Demequina sp.]|jgi:unsaturated rhamnogalacturonyl hydrolase|nr:hypothetical protein [Demequina sp.]
MPTSDAPEDPREEHRWQLLRWAPRHDSGVLYYPGHEGEVWADAIAEVVPFLVSTSDFAPADMQYRMHREHLWDPESGLYGEAFDVDTGTWVRKEPTASGNAKVARGMAEALRLGGDGTPAEMRGRWQRETLALIEAMRAAGFAVDVHWPA